MPEHAPTGLRVAAFAEQGGDVAPSFRGERHDLEGIGGVGENHGRILSGQSASACHHRGDEGRGDPNRPLADAAAALHR
jgi:hypothetical protein